MPQSELHNPKNEVEFKTLDYLKNEDEAQNNIDTEEEDDLENEDSPKMKMIP